MRTAWLKVFISHSQNDNYIARTIEEKLRALDVETYLSVKDTTTGEFIFDSVQKNLRDADEFLILLSPDSLQSDWCKIELGGAMFRTPPMKIVPIFTHIEREQLPGPVNRLQIVARSLDNIQQYFDELEAARKQAKPADTTLDKQDKIFSKPLSTEAGPEKLNQSYLEERLREKSVYAIAHELGQLFADTIEFARAAPPPALARRKPKARNKRSPKKSRKGTRS